MDRVVQHAPDARPVVLLVEDDADTRDMYHMALEFDGFRVIDSLSANEALTRAVETPPDVVVTDIGLRGAIDGVGVAERLKSDARTARVPVLAVTGHDPSALGPAAVLFEQVLLKPVLPELLSQRIKAVLLQSHAVRERSAAARRRVPDVLSRAQRAQARAEAVFNARARRVLAHPCPKCGALLEWRERRKVDGSYVDCYRPCAHGCGEFGFDHRAKRMVSMGPG